jgi:hypothetical protein
MRILRASVTTKYTFYSISTFLLITPYTVGITSQMRVVVAPDARNLLAYPLWVDDSLIYTTKLHLGDDKTLIVAIELIHLEGVTLEIDKIATLIYESTLT